MAVTRYRPSRRPTRRNVKARRPWSRSTRKLGTKTYRSVIPYIRNPDFGYPDKLVTKLRYVSHNTISGALGAVGAHVFRMNSLFDPDLTGTGHQPMFFDQFCGAVGSAPYSHYRVLTSTVTCTFTQVTAPANSGAAPANVGPLVVGLTAHGTQGLYTTDPENLCETSNTKWSHLGDKAAGNNTKVITATYNPIRDLGLGVDDDTISALYNANPTQQFFAIPWKFDRNALGATPFCTTEIIFTVEFFGRNEVAGS